MPVGVRFLVSGSEWFHSRCGGSQSEGAFSHECSAQFLLSDSPLSSQITQEPDPCIRGEREDHGEPE